MRFLNWLARMIAPPADCDEALAAKAAFEAAYPAFDVSRLKDQGNENGTRFIAVFYRSQSPSRPAPYKLFAITDGTAREVDIADHARFAIRGLK